MGSAPVSTGLNWPERIHRPHTQMITASAAPPRQAMKTTGVARLPMPVPSGAAVVLTAPAFVVVRPGSRMMLTAASSAVRGVGSASAAGADEAVAQGSGDLPAGDLDRDEAPVDP